MMERELALKLYNIAKSKCADYAEYVALDRVVIVSKLSTNIEYRITCSEVDKLLTIIDKYT